MRKLFIENRKGQNISVIIEQAETQKGLAFVMHGLGGFKEQDHIATAAEAFKERNFTVVRFDTTNTFGESDGTYEEATLTNYYEDLEDVIGWASGQDWYQEPFALSGHSFGGICTALFAENFPKKVSLLAPLSPVVSGQLSIEAHRRFDAEGLAEWERTGWREKKSLSKQEVVKRLPWSHIADRLKYDLLPNASKLIIPTLFIVGENDTSTPPDHVKILFDAVPGKKELHVFENAPHTFREKEQLDRLKRILLEWIDEYYFWYD